MHETIRCSYEALEQVEKVSSVFEGGRIFENDLHRVFARNGATGRAGARTPLGKSRQSLFSHHPSFSVSLILSLVIDSFLFFVFFFLLGRWQFSDSCAEIRKVFAWNGMLDAGPTEISISSYLMFHRLLLF